MIAGGVRAEAGGGGSLITAGHKAEEELSLRVGLNEDESGPAHSLLQSREALWWSHGARRQQSGLPPSGLWLQRSDTANDIWQRLSGFRNRSEMRSWVLFKSLSVKNESLLMSTPTEASY